MENSNHNSNNQKIEVIVVPDDGTKLELYRKALEEIKKNINIPLVVDIHFDYKIALEAAKYVDKLRINPGNIGNEEKVKFTESQKLKKLIKSQEEDLIRVKKERLNLISTITAEKELISKKTDEEKLKLKSQIELTKQLKKEEKSYDLLKKKREKIESQIKIKNQKLKEKQQKLKKQIDEKNKKLKSIAKKPVVKKVVKKPTKRKTSIKK